jgi:hypothetical protein
MVSEVMMDINPITVIENPITSIDVAVVSTNSILDVTNITDITPMSMMVNRSYKDRSNSLTDSLRKVRNRAINTVITLKNYYELDEDIIYISVEFINNYLSSHEINRLFCNHPVVLGCAAFITIANHVNDVYELYVLTSEIFRIKHLVLPPITKKTIINCQMDLLRGANWQLDTPTTYEFLYGLCEHSDTSLSAHKFKTLSRSTMYCKECDSFERRYLALSLHEIVYNERDSYVIACLVIDESELDRCISHLKSEHSHLIKYEKDS